MYPTLYHHAEKAFTTTYSHSSHSIARCPGSVLRLQFQVTMCERNAESCPTRAYKVMHQFEPKQWFLWAGMTRSSGYN